MPTFFNNSSARKHRGLYPVPFFDLNLSGRQEAMATNLQVGDECVVATPGQSGEVVFQWFKFSNEQILPDEEGRNVRVFYGLPLRSESLPKAVAAQTDPYAVFFDVNGHFKRPSAIARKADHETRPEEV